MLTKKLACRLFAVSCVKGGLAGKISFVTYIGRALVGKRIVVSCIHKELTG